MEHIGPSTIEREDWEAYYEGRIKELKAINNELLEALEWVYQGYLAEPGNADFIWDDWADRAEAAILKAKGE